MNKWQRRTLIAGAVFAGLVPAAAKQAGEQLSMTRIETVQSPDPATVQIIFYDSKGRRVTIQTNASVAQELAARISSVKM